MAMTIPTPPPHHTDQHHDVDHEQVDHEQVDHGQVDHEQVDHDQVDQAEQAVATEAMPEAAPSSEAGNRGIQPPETGHQEIDAALHGLAELDSAPLDSHHDRLASAHETLHHALHPDQGDQA